MNELDDFYSRKREQTLLIVEGEKEKDRLFQQIFYLFPELKINSDNIWIHHSNIYDLSRKIREYYGENWMEEEVDLPFLLAEADKKRLRLNDFKDIFMVFDFDPQDTFYSSETVIMMKKHFNDSTSEGMLYINYPMVESYLHFKSLPDDDFQNRNVSIEQIKSSNVCRGYKNTVSDESAIEKMLDVFFTIEKHLHRLHIEKNAFAYVRDKILESDLSLFCKKEETVLMLTGWLGVPFDELNKQQQSSLYSLAAFIITAAEGDMPGNSFLVRMKKIYQEITDHCVRKALVIQEENGITWENAKNRIPDVFYLIDHIKILSRQTNLVEREQSIHVLNTSLFLIPDYNIKLLCNDI